MALFQAHVLKSDGVLKSTYHTELSLRHQNRASAALVKGKQPAKEDRRHL